MQVVDGGLAARLALQADSEMVLKVLPHAAQLVRDLDPTRLQDARRSDPGELEQLRRIERSAAQDHLASGPRFPPAGLVPPDHAGRPLSLEHDPADQRVQHDIDALLRNSTEISGGRRPSAPFRVVVWT